MSKGLRARPPYVLRGVILDTLTYVLYRRPYQPPSKGKIMTTVRTVAQGVAANIERFGHYQDPLSESNALNEPTNPYGLCCIIANPTTRALLRTDQEDVVMEFHAALRDALAPNREPGEWVSLVTWSNNTPTRVVIDALRAL